MALLCSGSRAAYNEIGKRAYPTPMPADITFAKVLAEYPYPGMRYPVPVIGWKHHPDEIHVTPSGALVLPVPRKPAPLYVAPFLTLEGGAPRLLDPDAVVRSLVDGYKPGIYSRWKSAKVKVEQVAFGSLLEGQDVRTGAERLLGLVRYTVTNTSKSDVSGELLVNFGEGRPGIRPKETAPRYSHRLSFGDGMVTEDDGSVAALALTSTLGPVSFVPASAQNNSRDALFLNQEMATVNSPEYAISVTRSGDAVTVDTWESPEGIDITYFSPRSHSEPGVIEVRVEGAAKSTIGFLDRSGLSTALPPVSEFVRPGEAAATLKWAELKSRLGQGQSKIVLAAYYPGPDGPTRVRAWEPVFAITRPQVQPVFTSKGDPTTNTLRTPFKLKPGQSRSLELAVPYFPLGEAEIAKAQAISLQSRLAQFRSFWERELNRNARFDVPEKRVADSYRACLANNLMLVDRNSETGELLIHPDATDYENVWAGDASVVMQAMDWLGYHREVGEYARFFLKRQGTRAPEGDVDSAEGFFPGDVGLRWMSENGFVLWALGEHYLLTGDRAWLASVGPNIAASADWIVRQRARTRVMVGGEKPRHYGLLPKGRPSDLADWDYWYWNDTYSYIGLSRASEVLSDAGMPDQAARFHQEAADYKACIRESLSKSLNRGVSPPFVPLTPYLNADPTAEYLYRYWYPICSPVYMVEAGILAPEDDEARWASYWLEKLGTVSGLPLLGPDDIDPHYVYNTALAQLLRGETDKFVWSLYSLLAFGQARDTYATTEGTNIATGVYLSDSWNSHRQPHMHSNSRVIGMLRTALLLEEGDRLHLMRGAPRHWLGDGKKVEVARAPTRFGEVSYRAVSAIARGKVSVTVQPPARQKAAITLHVRPPSGSGKIRSVRVNGRSWTAFSGESVDLGRLDRETTIECAFR